MLLTAGDQVALVDRLVEGNAEAMIFHPGDPPANAQIFVDQDDMLIAGVRLRGSYCDCGRGFALIA